MAKEPKSKGLPFRRLSGSGIAPDELEFGFVAGVFGVRGEVRLHIHNPESELLAKPLDLVMITPSGERYAVVCLARPGAGKRIIGEITGLENRDLAASLKGNVFALPKSSLPAPDDDEFYVFEAVGALVWADGVERGRVKAVHETSEHDVFELDTSDGLVFIPVLREFILKMDLPNHRIDVVSSAFLEE